MLTIYELSRYQLGRLYAIDPNLDKHWQTTLADVFDLLDDEGRKSILDKLLTPRQITYNALNNTFLHLPPVSFNQFCATLNIENRKLSRIIQDLNALLANRQPQQKITDVADLLEAIFYHLNEIEIEESLNAPLLKKTIKKCFFI